MKIDVSVGECADKAGILMIKLEKIRDREKRIHVQNELDRILPVLQEAGLSTDSDDFKRLLAINETLWEIEDAIRIKEAKKEFDDAFIELARSVYKNNDRRAAVKREINEAFGSDLIEEKAYPDY